MNRIMVLLEKNETLYYDVSTDEQLYNVSLKILTSRFESGNYYFFDEEDKPEIPKISKEDAEKIIDEDVKICALSKIDDYECLLKEFNEDRIFFDAVKKTIKTKNGKLAYQLLRERKDAEYEEFEIIELDNIDKY